MGRGPLRDPQRPERERVVRGVRPGRPGRRAATPAVAGRPDRRTARRAPDRHRGVAVGPATSHLHQRRASRRADLRRLPPRRAHRGRGAAHRARGPIHAGTAHGGDRSARAERLLERDFGVGTPRAPMPELEEAMANPNPTSWMQPLHAALCHLDRWIAGSLKARDPQAWIRRLPPIRIDSSSPLRSS